MYAPPSTGIAAPVTNVADSEHRNAAIRPKSSGSPITPAGMPASRDRARRRRADRIRSVSWRPGWSEFTVTPSAGDLAGERLEERR